MSSISFVSPEGEARVRGPERALWDVLPKDWVMAVADLNRPLGDGMKDWEQHPLRKYIRSSHRLAGTVGRKWFDEIEYCLGDDDESLEVEGGPMSFWAFTMNTALRLGNDAVKLGVRLHGQCEIHTFVEGPNREWLAKIIERGRAAKLFRPDMGWEDVVTLLRCSNETPVVTSFSVTESFPDDSLVIQEGVWSPPEEDEEDDEGNRAWDRLGEAEQWRLGMEALRKFNERGRLELTPENWEDFYFGKDFSAFDL